MNILIMLLLVAGVFIFFRLVLNLPLKNRSSIILSV